MDSSDQSKAHEAGFVIPSNPAICDYEGSTYRTDFWTKNRTYEDAVERIALKALLPPSGHRLVEIGAGFGRLVDLYSGYDEVVLFDYSRSMLREAYAKWGETGPSGRPRYIYVAGDFNKLPFVPGLFDAVTMVRVIHHAPDAPRLLEGINEIIAPGGTFVLEFANKRNMKAISRWFLHRQKWNPFDPTPYEFTELNFDFHPHWIREHLKRTGFLIKAQRSVSHFRQDTIKRLIASRLLIKLDGFIQPTGRWWQFSPSVFVESQVAQTKPIAQEHSFYRCPECRSSSINRNANTLICKHCSRAYKIHGALLDFKESI
jgi:ubiquinone/menaquinone biosynthesis C-methylase UbiE